VPPPPHPPAPSRKTSLRLVELLEIEEMYLTGQSTRLYSDHAWYRYMDDEKRTGILLIGCSCL